MKTYKPKNGFIALVSVLIISAIAIIIGVSISLLGMSELQMGFSENQSFKAFNYADACTEEALERLRINWANYSGSLSFDEGSCTINTVVSGGSATINLVGTVDNFTRKIQISVDSSLNVTAWEELTS